jgi:hypothetical protein
MSWRTSAPGASIAFRLRQLSEVLRAFLADAQGRQRVDLTRSARPRAMTAICAFLPLRRRVERLG